jgi:hypothetical protein
MKQFVLTLVAVLVGGFLALMGYDQFVVKPREAEAARADAAEREADRTAVAPDLAQARGEAQSIAAEVEASLQRSVDKARSGMDAQAREMDRRALLTDAVQRATMFRVSLTEYYQTNGRWPQDADEAGLPSPEEMRGGAVRTVTVGAQGVVIIALDDTFGAGSEIRLRPQVSDAAGMVDWRCEVKGDAVLKQSLPRCQG